MRYKGDTGEATPSIQWLLDECERLTLSPYTVGGRRITELEAENEDLKWFAQRVYKSKNLRSDDMMQEIHVARNAEALALDTAITQRKLKPNEDDPLDHESHLRRGERK